jgi:GTP-binding protein
VDLPGYGYAKVSKDEKASWGKIIETYLMRRPQLARVLLLVDSRHKPTEDDLMMYNWIKYYGYEVVVVATKSDKITKNEMAKSNKIIRETLNLPKEQKIFYFSSLNRSGREEVLDVIFNNN